MTLIGPTSIPRWSYAAGKAVGEYLALGAHKRAGLPVTIVRCFNTCGPRQVSSHGMVIPTMLQQALQGEPLSVYGDGSQTRCFSYVGDVIRGVLELSRFEGARGEIFNIGTDEEISILQLAEMIRAVCESPSPIERISYRQAYGDGFEDVLRRVPNLKKIREAIAYEPRTDLAQLLRITSTWIQQQSASTASVS
jgi:UDP-glucose 4-epimerase